MSGSKRVLTDDRGAFGQQFIDETHLTGDYVVKTAQDVQPVLDSARMIRDLQDSVGPSKELRHVGYIPDVFMDEIMRKARAIAKQANGTIDGAAQEDVMKAEVKKFMNDPDNQMFRTWPGKI